MTPESKAVLAAVAEEFKATKSEFNEKLESFSPDKSLEFSYVKSWALSNAIDAHINDEVMRESRIVSVKSGSELPVHLKGCE